MAVLEPILQGLREWIYKSTRLDRVQIIPADDPFVRPALPYFMIDISQIDETIGTDELIYGVNAADNPTAAARGFRMGQITVNGYGPSAGDLLMQASLALRRPAMIKIMCDAGFSLRPISPMLDISLLASNEIEKRFAKDFELQYLLVDTDPEVLTELQTIEVGLTLERYDDDIAALIDSLIITC